MIKSPSEVAELVRNGTPFNEINFSYMCYHAKELMCLADLLIEKPDCVERLVLPVNVSTDEVGVKIARAIAASSTIEHLNLSGNSITQTTHLAIAEALRTNSSLSQIHLYGNRNVDTSLVNVAFVDALRFNPFHPIDSRWVLYGPRSSEFARLSERAKQLGAPSMLMYLEDAEEK